MLGHACMRFFPFSQVIILLFMPNASPRPANPIPSGGLKASSSYVEDLRHVAEVGVCVPLPTMLLLVTPTESQSASGLMTRSLPTLFIC